MEITLSKHHFNSVLAKIFLPKSVVAITLFGHVFYKKHRALVPMHIIYHEEIHLMQIGIDGISKFYFKYILDYLKLRIKGFTHTRAYFKIPYEREAYFNQSDFTYVVRTLEAPEQRKKYHV